MWIRRRSAGNRQGHDLVVVDQGGTANLQQVRIAGTFELFKGDEHIRLATPDDGGMHFFAVPHLRGNGAATLCHAVHFAHLDIITRGNKASGEGFAHE